MVSPRILICVFLISTPRTLPCREAAVVTRAGYGSTMLHLVFRERELREQIAHEQTVVEILRERYHQAESQTQQLKQEFPKSASGDGDLNPQSGSITELSTRPSTSSGTYVVKIASESLYRIAEKVYGNGSEWPLIYQANKQQIDSNYNRHKKSSSTDRISHPEDFLVPGQVLIIPPSDFERP